MSTSLNHRTVATVGVFSTLLIILVTSILMFARSYSSPVATVHTVIGFVFLSVAIWHLVNNYASLKRYIHPKTLFGRSSKFSGSSKFAVVVSICLLLLAAFQFEPFKRFHNWGTSLRIASSTNKSQNIDVLEYKVISMNQSFAGQQINVDLRKGSAFYFPQYAIWMEDLSGDFIQPLFVTNSVASNTYKNKVWLKDGIAGLTENPFSKEGFVFESLFGEQYDESASNNKFRQESLPVFLHKLKQGGAVSEPISAEEIAMLDGYTGATMFDHYLLKNRARQPIKGKVNVFFEINQSFDFNDYYSSDRFAEDPIYSGDGYSAQPSVIYKAEVDLDSDAAFYPMTLIGHGHHSGLDGKVYSDLANLTSALALIDRLIIEVGE